MTVFAFPRGSMSVAVFVYGGGNTNRQKELV
jgi:hypothetical protein